MTVDPSQPPSNPQTPSTDPKPPAEVVPDAAPRRKIQVGSRPPYSPPSRAAEGLPPQAPDVESTESPNPSAGESTEGKAAEDTLDNSPMEPFAPSLPGGKVPPPSRRDPMTPDLERALDSVLGGASMDD
ncbi:MAG: hypothetical protein JJ992_28335, partial [Planctomycetes bacterium]|nr:hypothetical protein [Planctomycetota bacterium]